MTVVDETNCAGYAYNGAVLLSAASGGGATGNLCHVDCSNRGVCLCVHSLTRCYCCYDCSLTRAKWFVVRCLLAGKCDYSNGLCKCFEGHYGEACEYMSALARDQSYSVP